MNIYEPVLAASLGCVLADAPIGSLEITTEIQSFFYHHLAGKNQSDIEQTLHNALSKLSESLSFSDRLLLYVRQRLPQLSVTIEDAMKTENLEHVFLVSEYPEDNPKLTISYGEIMIILKSLGPVEIAALMKKYNPAYEMSFP